MIEVTIVQYGMPNEKGEIVSRRSAEHVFRQLLKQRLPVLPGVPGWYLIDVRIDFDKERGGVYGTYQLVVNGCVKIESKNKHEI